MPFNVEKEIKSLERILKATKEPIRALINGKQGYKQRGSGSV